LGVDGEGLEDSYWARRVTETEGEWAGWTRHPGADPFEDLAGPFYHRKREDGVPVCAFRAERKHLNGGGFLHGGLVMTFADFSLFVIARDHLAGSSTVTATFNAELVGTAHEGALVECTGDVVKAGRSMIFCRGLITCADEPVMSFSSTLKKTTPRRPT
jgi:acyl-coenzyme A thioesterase PaaI-like protein